MRIGRSSTRCGREAPDLQLRLHVDPAELRNGRRARVRTSWTPTRVTTTSTSSVSTCTTRVEMPDDIGVDDGDHCGWKDPAAVFETYHRPALETAARVRRRARQAALDSGVGVCRAAASAMKPSTGRVSAGATTRSSSRRCTSGWRRCRPPVPVRSDTTPTSRAIRTTTARTRSPSSPRHGAVPRAVRFIVRRA